MPLLARLLAAPLVIDVRPGNLENLGSLLADQRISTTGRVAVVVGATRSAGIVERLTPLLTGADWYVTADCSVDTAQRITDEIRGRGYEAVVGIGGGRVLDVAKFIAARAGLPMVAVATNLAHDGIASPISILDQTEGRSSYGVPLPIAVIVDLDEVQKAPRDMVAAGIGDVVSNLSAIADWELSRVVTGEQIDGLAVAMARTAGESLLHRQDSVEDSRFLVALTNALVLSGMAMSVSGTSRPCSGACHEISHAIDALYPEESGLHGFQVGVGATFASYLRGDAGLTAEIVTCLARHGLPVLPTQLGITNDQFVAAVMHAPSTRPGRFTILEHLELTQPQVESKLQAYLDTVASGDFG